jgi:hypothetical protein
VVLILLGIVKIVLVKRQAERGQKTITDISLVFGILAVLFLALTRDAYAIVIAFLLLVIKSVLMLKSIRKV